MDEQKFLDKKTYLLFAIFLIMVTLLINLTEASRTKVSGKQFATGQTIANSYINLTTTNNTLKFPLGQPINFQIMADSDGKEVVGYDVLVSYDNKAFNLTRLTSLQPNFDIYKFDKPDHLSITAVQSLSNKNAIIFTATALTEMVFQPKMVGRYTFTLLQMSGKEKTEFVSNQVERIYPRLNAITIEIY